METVDYTLDPCTNHPEFWMRLRAYLMTIAFLSIKFPDFLSFEQALVTSDFFFESINCRPDGKRLTM